MSDAIIIRTVGRSRKEGRGERTRRADADEGSPSLSLSRFVYRPNLDEGGEGSYAVCAVELSEK